MRELLWMLDGQRRDSWDHTACLASWIVWASANRDPKKPMPPMHKFHPYMQAAERPGNWKSLKEDWLKVTKSQRGRKRV